MNSPRKMISAKKTSVAIMITLAFLLPYRHAPADETGAGPVKSIAHDFLELEKEFGAGEKHRLYIDGFIAKARKKVKAYANDDTNEAAIATLKSIDALLAEEGFRFHNNHLLSRGIDSKKIDCDNYSTLYVAIAEALRLPIIPVYAPNHSFVRFVFRDGTYLNWEPLKATPLPDAYYIQQLLISGESIKKGVYMKGLNRKEFFGVQYNSIGSHLMAGKKYGEAVPYFTMAIGLNPLFSPAYHNRGTAYYAQKQTRKALEDLVKANELDPLRASTHNTLGDIYFDRKEYESAISHYKETIKLEPGFHAPYHNLGLIMRAMGREDAAEKLLKIAEEVRKKNAR